MIALVKAEVLKIFTARSSAIAAAGGIALAFLVTVLSGIFAEWSGTLRPGMDLMNTGQVTFFFVLVLGVLTIGGEFRHGSIAPSLLVTPVRLRLLTAKLIALVAVSALVALVAVAGCVALGFLILSARDIELNLGAGDFWKGLLTAAGAAPLYAAIGLGTAAILRNQTGAIVLILVWLFVLEGIVRALFPGYDPYSLGASLASASGTDSGVEDPLSQAAGFLVAGGWAVVLLAAGALVISRSDITG